MGMYTSFSGFKKNHNLAQNPELLAFGFTEKRYFTAKTDRNTVFLDREANILDRL
jgi:hypothetical protein